MIQKYICITGASSGIGQALAEHYSQKPEYTLLLSARNQESADILASKFPNAEIYIADFSQKDSGTHFAQNLMGKNILSCILAAGTGKYGAFGDMKTSEISEQMQVNTTSPLEIVHSCREAFQKNNTKIVYLSSVVADMPLKNMSVYGASKGAMNYALGRISEQYPALSILNLHLGAVQTPMHITSGMGEMKGRKLEDVIPKIIFAIEHKQGNRWIYPDWFLASYAMGPILKIIFSLKQLGKKY